jgi:N-acetylglutamate synthase-like GNAT family acetyltransferase
MKVIMNDNFFLEKGFIISTDKSLIDFEAVHHYLDQESYWAKGIPVERMKRAIENSICFGIYKQNKLAGFARVVTDKATFGYICDVFVLADYRRLGLSKWLMQTIVQHPEFQGLRRWSLATFDAHELYSQFGFNKLSKPESWMEIFTPYIKTPDQGGD